MIGCLVLIGLFGLMLIVSTACMGSNVFISLQVLMGSLKYSKEVDDKIQLELGKIDAGMCDVSVDEHTIGLYVKTDKDVDFRYRTPYMEIWVENKFYSYGNIYRMNGQSSYDFKSKRPSIAVIKQLLELQRSKGESTKKIKKKDKKQEKTVILE
jgi:hypothetical protein